MIAGIFGGTTAGDLIKLKDQIASLEDRFQRRKSEAIADRTAAIEELKKDLDTIANL